MAAGNFKEPELMVTWPWLIVTFSAGGVAAGLAISWRYRRKLLRILEQVEQYRQDWETLNDTEKN